MPNTNDGKQWWALFETPTTVDVIIRTFFLSKYIPNDGLMSNCDERTL